MKAQVLKNQLIREMRGSPVKAIALASLTLVGLYFWVPMAWRKIAGKAEAPAVEAAGADLAVIASATSAANAVATAASQPNDWQTLADLIASDARMAPAAAEVAERDPFAPTEATQVAAAAKKDKKKASATNIGPIEPEDMGLVLSSTVVGNRDRTALINGRAYREGRSIQLSDGTVFVLTAVLPQRVVLTRDGHEFELKIRKRTLGGSDTPPATRPAADSDDESEN